ncbi:hypothetical protein WDA79_00335 [Streptomyces sp. A475]|uniref:hypothetical protein n=1 Tax=Streptomyces sp. A475 TaxID=3131976 RepID=UPI0030C979F5
MTELAYRVARIVEDESGLTGHDFEVDQPTRTGAPAKAAARLSSVSDWGTPSLPLADHKSDQTKMPVMWRGRAT